MSNPSDESRTKTLVLYRRLSHGRKQLFAASADAPAQYYVINPVPHKHHQSWKPLFYRGGNPKYATESSAIGRARRTALWSSISVWMGDGVAQELENERRRKARKRVERMNKWRRWLGMKPKPGKEEVEEEMDITGEVLPVRMGRKKIFSRQVEWELRGEQYRWSRTRRFARGLLKGRKGWSMNLKLVRQSDKALIATFERSSWLSRLKSFKARGPPVEKRSVVGTLRIYQPVDAVWPVKELTKNVNAHDPTKAEQKAPVNDGIIEKAKPDESDATCAQEGQAGDVIENAIAFTCWIVVEAEHRLRHKAFDLSEEVTEALKE